MQRGVHEDGVLVVGKERIPPGIEHVLEADAKVHGDDGAHYLARPRSKLSHAERTAAAKARRANANTNFDVGAQLGIIICFLRGRRRKPAGPWKGHRRIFVRPGKRSYSKSNT